MSIILKSKKKEKRKEKKNSKKKKALQVQDHDVSPCILALPCSLQLL